MLASTFEDSITADDLFAYAYGVLAQPAYVESYWDELEQPPPRLPITKDRELFLETAELGRQLISLQTYGARFPHSADRRGQARCTVPVPTDEYPEHHFFDDRTGSLHVGSGVFHPVSAAIYEYSISGRQVVKSWLNYRQLKRAGRSSSELDDARPNEWVFTEELLELLWAIEGTLDLTASGDDLLRRISLSEVFSDIEVPSPFDQERLPPDVESGGPAEQGSLDL